MLFKQQVFIVKLILKTSKWVLRTYKSIFLNENMGFYTVLKSLKTITIIEV